eukprot:Phypoly_transcript_12120.p1 GENE.Phypoly_transcript_12120~~Phypoly_transcript_12120.p1  ORF type:complete len:347 (+),score=49.51 Phypoly_transcript_12120:10-1050(+)
MLLQGEHGALPIPTSSSLKMGRGNLGVSDKRCSRHQANLEYNKHGKLQLVSKGKNPTVVLKDSGVNFLKAEQSISLAEGDTIFLALPEYSFQVKRKREADSEDKPTKKSAMEIPSTKVPFTTTTTTTTSSSSHNHEPPEDDPILSNSLVNKKQESGNFGGLEGLLVYCDHPDDPKYKDCVVEYDDSMVVIYDKYPKAEYHFLVLPRVHIRGPHVLNSAHVPVVKSMLQKAQDMVAKVNKTKKVPVKFSIGFHAVPSMSQLHLHVISKDMNSPAMKTKKHWNSFTTEFFVDGHEFLRILEDKGAVKFDKHTYESMLKQDLRCHLCREELPNIPKLKAHLLTHSHSKG